MALTYSNHLRSSLVVYDCMDELSGFRFAHPEIVSTEKALFKKADLVFTGGQNLFMAKKALHDNIHSFPSSIDKKHFLQARKIEQEPDANREEFAARDRNEKAEIVGINEAIDNAPEQYRIAEEKLRAEFERRRKKLADSAENRRRQTVEAIGRRDCESNTELSKRIKELLKGAELLRNFECAYAHLKRIRAALECFKEGAYKNWEE
jgi:hypothetical protein